MEMIMNFAACFAMSLLCLVLKIYNMVINERSSGEKEEREKQRREPWFDLEAFFSAPFLLDCFP